MNQCWWELSEIWNEFLSLWEEARSSSEPLFLNTCGTLPVIKKGPAWKLNFRSAELYFWHHKCNHFKWVKLLHDCHMYAKRTNSLNLLCLVVTQTGVTLRCLHVMKCAFISILLLFFSAGSHCCLNPAASSVSHSSVRKALYISLCCALSISPLLFSPRPKKTPQCEWVMENKREKEAVK